MDKQEISTGSLQEDLEEYMCSKCFYCVDIDIMEECFACTKLNKKIKEFAYQSEACCFFRNYWDVFNLIEKGDRDGS